MQPFQFPDQVEIGQTTSTMCAVVSGKPPFVFKWYKDGSLLEGDGINTQRKISNLIIDPVHKSSRGNYTCIVSNADGKGSYSAFLRIKGKVSFLKNCFIRELQY